MVCHIGAFSVYFHVSSVLFLSGVKRPSGCANVALQTCAAGNFVDNIALVFFFRAEFRCREFLLECFNWFIGNRDAVLLHDGPQAFTVDGIEGFFEV